MQDHVTFVQLTDLHIGDPDLEDKYLLTDTSSTLAKLLEEVKRVHPVPAFVVISGDLTNRGDYGSFVELKRLLAEANLAMPVILALGNHDTRPHFYQVMLGRTDNLQAPYDHDEIISGIHIITLDTSVFPVQSIGIGALEPGQLEWLTSRLDAHPELRKLVVMHHPPALDDNVDLEWQSMSIADTAVLASVFKGRDNVLGVLCGHMHHDRVTHWHGIPVVMATGQHSAMDVLQLHNSLRELAGTSFVVGTIRPSGMSVAFVHQPATREQLQWTTYDQIAEHAKSFHSVVRTHETVPEAGATAAA